MNYVLATGLAVALVALCVTIHYETLKALAGMNHRPGRHRWLILATMNSALIAHVVEIWLFAGGYWLAVDVLELGAITNLEDPFDFVYYSAMVYTTVGFGDLIPKGPIRMLTGTEALAGLALITWVGVVHLSADAARLAGLAIFETTRRCTAAGSW